MLFMVIKLSHGRNTSERASCLWLDDVRDTSRQSHTRLTQKLGRWFLSNFQKLIDSVDTRVCLHKSELSEWRNALRGECPDMMGQSQFTTPPVPILWLNKTDGGTQNQEIVSENLSLKSVFLFGGQYFRICNCSVGNLLSNSAAHCFCKLVPNICKE